jgi:hypothetical protein
LECLRFDFRHKKDPDGVKSAWKTSVLIQFDPAILQAIHRASKRSSAVVREEMKGDAYSVATIACVAPWVGLFGTILGIVNSFPGIDGEKTSLMAALCNRLSESLWPTALGLAIGIVALWCYRYLEVRLQSLDHEMESASLDLLNQLSRLRGRFSAEPASKRVIDGPMFREESLAEITRDEKFQRRSMFLGGAAIVLAWLVQALRLSLEAAFLDVPLMFVISCLFTYPVWTKLLHRRSGGLAALASLFCLSWCLAELASGTSLP